MKKRKKGDWGNGYYQKKIKTQVKKNKISTNSLGMNLNEREIQVDGMNIRAIPRSLNLV